MIRGSRVIRLQMLLRYLLVAIALALTASRALVAQTRPALDAILEAAKHRSGKGKLH